MADKDSAANDNNRKLKKIGLILKGTPKLVVIVEKDDSELATLPKRRFRKKTLPIRGLYRNSDLGLISADLCRRHPFLAGLPRMQLEKLLSIMQETLNGASVAEAIRLATQRYALDPDEDLNRLDDKALKVKKELMSESFEKNAIRPGDPNFKYDVEADFNTFETSAGWDSDSDEIMDF